MGVVDRDSDTYISYYSGKQYSELFNWRRVNVFSLSDLLAQLVEHLARDWKVPGSNPRWSLDFLLTVIYVICAWKI